MGVIEDYVNLWSKNITHLLERLRDTVPGEGMIGEVHYWRDLARILDAANEEVKQSYVEICVQVLSHQKGDEVIAKTVDTFMKQKSKVALGTKEAKWNHKYMKVIEKPVSQIELATEFRDI